MLLRYFGMFVVIALIIIGILWFITRDAKKTLSKELDPVKRAKLINADAVSQLEKLLHDPMKIGDPDWEKESRYVVNAAKGIPPRPRKKKY